MICVKCKKDAPDAPYCALCGWKQSQNPTMRTKRGNGLGTVYKHGKGWRAQVTLYTTAEPVDGKKVYKQKRRTKDGFATKKAALEYIATLRSAEGRRTPTMLELYAAWEKNDLPKLSESKKSAYKKARERIDGIIGRKIDTVTVADLQAIVDSQSSSYYTARDIKTLFSHIYKKALPDQYVTSNLADYIVLPRHEEKEAEPFAPDEVQKIWNAFADGDTFAGYMLLMIYTGMMPGELLACKKDMIDYERREIYGCGKKTKTRKSVAIVFPDFLIPVLEAICEASDGETLMPLYENKFYEEYHAATKRIGIRDLPPYSCRHTTGTEAARLNFSAPAIQNVMRHAKITTTQRYIHLGSEIAHDVVNGMRKEDS